MVSVWKLKQFYLRNIHWKVVKILTAVKTCWLHNKISIRIENSNIQTIIYAESYLQKRKNKIKIINCIISLYWL